MGPSGHFVHFSDITIHAAAYVISPVSKQRKKAKQKTKWNEIHIDWRVSASIEMAIQSYDCRASNKDLCIVPTEKQKVSVVLGFVSRPQDRQTPANVTFNPYSRQMQLWPMTPSTSCPCPTSTPRRWRSTRCSATATSPGGLAAASWASSKRWGQRRREGKTLLVFSHLLFFNCYFFALWLDHHWHEGVCWSSGHGVNTGRAAASAGSWIFTHQMDRSSAHIAERELIDTSKRCCCHLCKFPSFHNLFSPFWRYD